MDPFCLLRLTWGSRLCSGSGPDLFVLQNASQSSGLALFVSLENLLVLTVDD